MSALLPQLPPEEAEAALGRDAGAEGPRSRLYNFEDRLRLVGRVADLDVEAIRPNPYQPRKDFDEEALEELAASIRQLGIIQPLTVRAMGNALFELISGERRLRAAKRAGLRRVPAYVREASTEEILEMALVENVQRADLNPVEEAMGYHRLIEEVGLTQEEAAERVGKSRSTVANALRLLRLPPRVLASLRDGSLTAGHARMLVAMEDEEAQLRLHRAILDRGLSVREVERLARDHRERRAAPPAPAEPGAGPAAEAAPAPALPERDRLQVDAFEAQLRERLGTRVEVRTKAEGAGTIQIAFYSQEDLERLMEQLAP